MKPNNCFTLSCVNCALKPYVNPLQPINLLFYFYWQMAKHAPSFATAELMGQPLTKRRKKQVIATLFLQLDAMFQNWSAKQLAQQLAMQSAMPPIAPTTAIAPTPRQPQMMRYFNLFRDAKHPAVTSDNFASLLHTIWHDSENHALTVTGPAQFSDEQKHRVFCK
jgi:hypothetical protein